MNFEEQIGRILCVSEFVNVEGVNLCVRISRKLTKILVYGFVFVEGLNGSSRFCGKMLMVRVFEFGFFEDLKKSSHIHEKFLNVWRIEKEVRERWRLERERKWFCECEPDTFD